MRKVFLFLAIILLPVDFMRADDGPDAARSASRAQSTVAAPAAGGAATARSAPQQRAKETTPSERGAAKGEKSENAPIRTAESTVTRSAVRPVVASGASRATAATTAPVAAQSRVAPQVVSRAAATQKVAAPRASSVAAGRGVSVQSRAAARPVISSGATNRTAAAAKSNVNRGRAAAMQKVVGTSISSAYTFCRETYFSCMDEFCANKDASLRRCACSSRLHEFDDDKRVLELAQSKLTDFQERLLAVNMDKEDAAAMVRATAGETAYNVNDNSASQKALDSILQKINAKTTETRQTQSLAAINLATTSGGDIFDPVDSMLGANATAKEGEELYRAALPTCVEMANEVCDSADIGIVQSSYLMSIEQDCNTLSKNYDSLKAVASDKAREGGALLDMSRLTNWQDRNSADILTCTKQMLEIIAKDAVCGADLGKCLDPSGKYIDPTTGSAILFATGTDNLADLADVLKRPDGNRKWVDVPENDAMVRFLGSKRTYIEPATENCDDIKQPVWENFLEEALAKIKIAQFDKLENIKTGCTTLVGECKRGVNQSIQDFDPRALSIFGVLADSTVNQMCADIQSACGAVMARSWGDEGDTNGIGAGWATGMKEVDLEKTYSMILQNCTLVGQECLRLQCQTSENQFGLCTEQGSGQRRMILNDVLSGNYCYQEVSKCVAQVPREDLDIIAERLHGTDLLSFDGCAGLITDGDNTCADPTTRIARTIWGGCSASLTNLTSVIRQEAGKTGNTILSWFGTNTNNPSCYTGYCAEGLYSIWSPDNDGQSIECGNKGSSVYERCISSSGGSMDDGGFIADETSIVKICENSATDSGGCGGRLTNLHDSFKYSETVFTNCCYSGIKDKNDNCCQIMGEYGSGAKRSTMDYELSYINMVLSAIGGICNSNIQCCFESTHTGGSSVNGAWTEISEGNGGYPGNSGGRGGDNKYCVPDGQKLSYIATDGNTHLFCLGTLNNADYNEGNQIVCSNTDNQPGTFVTVDSMGIYRSSFNGGREKYLNYFYVNDDNSAIQTQGHRKLCIRRGNTWVRNDDGTTNPGPNGSCGDPKSHSVAYCEYGFKFSTDKDFIGCCGSTEPCDPY